MGMLYDEATGEHIVLRAEHVFGRNRSRSDTYLPYPDISMMHAVARWREGQWSVADYGRNGTFLDGQALPKGRWIPLRAGQSLRFGAESRSTLRVEDVSAPVASLVSDERGVAPTELGPNNLLPNQEAPEVSIYRTESGSWMLESDGEIRTLGDGDSVRIAGREYRLLLNDGVDETTGPTLARSARSLKFCFRVSDDEEHASLQVLDWANVVDLGERIHHYCLLTLARRRVADAGAGLELGEQGWLRNAELSRLLKIEPLHLNLQIFRARHQLMSALPEIPELANIVERRRGTLRLGPFAFDILKGTQAEARYRPHPPSQKMASGA
jgi:pSer/pThr/pTyr-binding forkhead associated (FHA) protein